MYSFEGNRVIRHTGTEYPIFQAPIGLISRASLVGAVSAAGGVGLMETASLPMPQMQEEFDQIRARSNRPFGLHLMTDSLHTFALLQKARRCIDIPIVASGGIVDGYGMAAAFALGAEGIWMGTRFIASEECPWHENYKEAIVDADRVIAIDMNLPNIPSMRAVRNSFAEAVARGEAGHRKNPYAGEAMKLFYEGRTDLALVGCGESAVLIDAVKPAAQIIQDTVTVFWGEIERLSKLREA